MCARLSSYGSMVQIARENLTLALECQETVNILRKTLDGLEGFEREYFLSQELSPVETKLGNYCSITIVFSASAVEGYIYDYAARNLTDNFVEAHIDKLSVISKLIVVTKLVTGKDFPKEGQTFELINKLIKDRNDIVHSKSTNLIKDDVEINLTGQESSEDIKKLFYTNKATKLFDFANSILDSAKNSITAMDELATVMKSLDQEESHAFILTWKAL